MTSPITSLPGITKLNDSWTLPNKYSTLAWIAVVEKFGFFTPPPIPICYKGQELPIKKWEELILSKTITESNKNPFEAQDILTRGKDGAHDICQWAVDNKLGSESSSIP